MGVFAILDAFVSSKAGKITLEILAILGIVTGIFLYGRHLGVTAGHVSGAKEQLDSDRRDMQSDRAAFQQQLNSFSSQSAAKDALIAQEAGIIQTINSKLSLLDQQSAAQQAQISRLTDPQVILDLARRLGLRESGDVTASLYPGEIRKADSMVADDALQSQRVDDLSKKIGAQQAQLDAVGQKQQISDQKLAAALTYINQSDQRFADAYNVFNSIHHRSILLKILTLGIVRDQHIQKLAPVVQPEKPETLK